jgi:membrane fusion protein (multidrug efflux system)
MRKQIIVWAMLCCLGLASCQNAKTEDNKQESQEQEYPVLTVGVSSVETTDYYPASIQGQQDIEIYPQVSGKIVRVSVTEGGRITTTSDRFDKIQGVINLYHALGGGAE